MTWEEIFRSWSKPPTGNEEERCANAETAVKNAIESSAKFKNRKIKIISQGSYRNNTNVRRDSDVDIGIICRDVFYSELPDGYKDEDFGIKPGNYEYSVFKNEVEDALVSYFGRNSVVRGNMAFDIKQNSYRVEADVTPFFEHRRYKPNGKHIPGVELRPDKGGRVINWPEQHYENGVSKNAETKKRFKALVRIIKALCNYMAEQNVDIAKSTPGFLVECLVWNVHNNHFGGYTYSDDVKACLAFLYNNTASQDKCSEWGEISELKYLFRDGKKWTREQAHRFISSAWDFVGFK